jgi:hypothetical protein
LLHVYAPISPYIGLGISTDFYYHLLPALSFLVV